MDACGLPSVRSYVAAAVRPFCPLRFCSLTPHQVRVSSLLPGSCYIPQGLSCVPCNPKTGTGNGLVVTGNSSLNAGLNLGLLGNVKANTTLTGTGDLRIGTTLDTSLDAKASVGTNVQLAANGTANTDLSASSSLYVNSKTNAHLDGTAIDIGTSLNTTADVDANLSTNAHLLDGTTTYIDTSLDATADVDVNLSTNTHLLDGTTDIDTSLNVTADVDATVKLSSNA